MSNFVPEKTALGIEFGSTRIKAVLIGPEHTPLAQGDYTWENQLHNGIWTYPLEQVWQGLTPGKPPSQLPPVLPHGTWLGWAGKCLRCPCR